MDPWLYRIIVAVCMVCVVCLVWLVLMACQPQAGTFFVPDKQLTERELRRCGQENVPSTFAPRVCVAFVRNAHARYADHAQYTLPAALFWASRNEYTLAVVDVEDSSVDHGMVRGYRHLVTGCKEFAEADYVVVLRHDTMIRESGFHLSPVLWRYMEQHPERCVGLPEHCYSPHVSGSVVRAIKCRSTAPLQIPCMWTAFMFVKQRPTQRGWDLEIDAALSSVEQLGTGAPVGLQGIGAMPHNLVHDTKGVSPGLAPSVSLPWYTELVVGKREPVVWSVRCDTVARAREHYETIPDRRMHLMPPNACRRRGGTTTTAATTTTTTGMGLHKCGGAVGATASDDDCC